MAVQLPRSEPILLKSQMLGGRWWQSTVGYHIHSLRAQTPFSFLLVSKRSQRASPLESKGLILCLLHPLNTTDEAPKAQRTKGKDSQAHAETPGKPASGISMLHGRSSWPSFLEITHFPGAMKLVFKNRILSRFFYSDFGFVCFLKNGMRDNPWWQNRLIARPGAPKRSPLISPVKATNGWGCGWGQ